MPKFLILFSFLVCELRAQVYPVQGSATLIPPYSLRLSDYATAIFDRLVLNALLADVSKAEVRVRFRISIQGQNVKLETKPEYIGTPIALQGGIPLRLTNIELAEYFDPNHLNFSGISKASFQKAGFLPEFCFEVYEYNRGVKISNTICAPAWLILNDPPIINLPQSGSKQKPMNPQNVIMQWTPRHSGSPNAAFTTEYDIRVVEVWPASRNANDAMLSQPPIYETTTTSTTLIYGADATQLEPGRTYAFRVQAKAQAGAEALDLFKNNGYSETVTFVYGDACEAPAQVSAQAESPTRISLQWEASPSQTGYTVRYRTKDQADANWYSNTSLITTAEVSGLEPKTTYEYQLMATCGYFESSYGNLATITTPDMAQQGYTCGVAPPNINLDKTQLIPTLKVGEVLKAGDFDVTVTKISGANGKFSGEGVVVVPFLNQVRGRVIFSDITVNTDKRMVDGMMNVTGGVVEVVPASVQNAMDQLTQGLSAADSILSKGQEILDAYEDQVMITKASIVSVSATDGNIVIEKSDGTQQVIDKKDLQSDGMAVTDTNGNGYEVNKDGQVNKLTTATPQGPSFPRQIDTNQLDDFEKLVKEVIDSAYSLKVSLRDTLAKAKDKKQDELDTEVSLMNGVHSGAEDQELAEDGIDIVDLMTKIELLDSLIENKKIAIKRINENLDALNTILERIKEFSTEVRKADDYSKVQSILERRRKISEYIENKLKK